MTQNFNAIVIGAGPAGLAVVGQLLDHQIYPIAWIDPSFKGGRLIKYPEVPSNTKVKLFLKYANASSSFVSAVESSCSNLDSTPLTELKSLDPNNGCTLSLAQAMCENITLCLLKQFSSKLRSISGWVKAIDFNPTNEVYECEVYLGVKDTFQGPPEYPKVTTPPPLKITGSYLILCTGSEPKLPPSPHTPYLPLETCLSPTLLKETLFKASLPSSPTFHIIGGSHSAVLCLKNIHEVSLWTEPPTIYLEKRHPFMYAVDHGDWIIYDNRGLKLIAAEFAKQLERACPPSIHFNAPPSNVPIHFTVYAIGYQPHSLPLFSIQGQPTKLNYDPCTAQLQIANQINLPKAYGFGIAFPEKIIDTLGEVEWNVGLWKFMKYVQKVLKP